MKKLIYILLMPVLCFSCVQDEPDIFDKPASERMNAAIENARNILVSAEYGWQADYYPYVNYARGGYAMFLKFYNDGTVDVQCEIITNVPARQKETSQFSMTADQGPVLTFNTYNKVMHYFSEPLSSSQTSGREGDYEFIVMSATPDKIVLKGKKRGNMFVLRRNLTAVDANAYLIAAANLAVDEDVNNWGLFSLTVNGTERGSADISYRNFDNFTYTESGKTTTTTTRLSYAFTPDGVRLYQPFTIDGVTMERFVWDPVTARYNCVEPAGVDAYFTGKRDPDHSGLEYEDFVGTYTMAFTSTYTAPVPAIRPRTTTVRIEVANAAEKTYYLRDFVPNATHEAQSNIIAYYNKRKGTMSIGGQYMFPYSTYFIHWTVVTQGGSISVSSTYGMVSSNHTTSPITFEWVSNGAWSGQTQAGFLFYAWTSQSGGSTAGWLYTDSATVWRAICYPKFTKQ